MSCLKITVESDGASLPDWERTRIIKKYGLKVIRIIDWCGYRHDARMYVKCIDKDLARALFFVDLINNKVPVELTERLYIGLYIYDKCPVFIKSLFKKMVKVIKTPVEVDLTKKTMGDEDTRLL
jgi:hypothetical protein